MWLIGFNWCTLWWAGQWDNTAITLTSPPFCPTFTPIKSWPSQREIVCFSVYARIAKFIFTQSLEVTTTLSVSKILFVWIIYHSHRWYLQLNLDNKVTDTRASDSEQPILSLDWVTPQDHKHPGGSMGSVVMRSLLGQTMWVLLPPLTTEAASSASLGARGSWRLCFGYHGTKQWSTPPNTQTQSCYPPSPW